MQPHSALPEHSAVRVPVHRHFLPVLLQLLPQSLSLNLPELPQQLFHPQMPAEQALLLKLQVLTVQAQEQPFLRERQFPLPAIPVSPQLLLLLISLLPTAAVQIQAVQILFQERPKHPEGKQVHGNRTFQQIIRSLTQELSSMNPKVLLP